MDYDYDYYAKCCMILISILPPIVIVHALLSIIKDLKKPKQDVYTYLINYNTYPILGYTDDIFDKRQILTTKLNGKKIRFMRMYNRINKTFNAYNQKIGYILVDQKISEIINVKGKYKTIYRLNIT